MDRCAVKNNGHWWKWKTNENKSQAGRQSGNQATRQAMCARLQRKEAEMQDKVYVYYLMTLEHKRP